MQELSWSLVFIAALWTVLTAVMIALMVNEPVKKLFTNLYNNYNWPVILYLYFIAPLPVVLVDLII